MSTRKQLDLFSEPKAHDPGGKVRSLLLPDTVGDADISECGRYRHILRRWSAGTAFPQRHILWIGMNPSTADGTFNDPTIRREWEFTTREGFSGFAKVNIADYRATEPKVLMAPDVVPVSPGNLDRILTAAHEASLVIICHGKLNKALAAAGALTVEALQAAGIPLLCLGQNLDGSPKHPLYLAGSTPLQPFGAPPT